MPTIPNKLQHGDNWKSASVNAINQIIDYLRSQRIVGDNKTVSITQSVNGITITAKPQTSAKPSSGKGEGEGGFEKVTLDAGDAMLAVGNETGKITIQMGFGTTQTQTKNYSLPTALSFWGTPPKGERFIIFKTYI